MQDAGIEGYQADTTTEAQPLAPGPEQATAQAVALATTADSAAADLNRKCQWPGCTAWIEFNKFWKKKTPAAIIYCATCKVLAKSNYDKVRRLNSKRKQPVEPQTEAVLQQLEAPASEIQQDLAPPAPPPPIAADTLDHLQDQVMSGEGELQEAPEPPKMPFDDGHNCWGNMATAGQLRSVMNNSFPRPVPISHLHEKEEQKALDKVVECLSILAPDHLVFAFVASGSDANLRMLHEASGDHLAKAGVGSGLYLTGDTTSSLWPMKFHCITKPGGVGTIPLHSARPITAASNRGLRLIPLPWHCPALMKKEDGQALRNAEMASLRVLTEELTKGMKALLIELVNTAYGFELSTFFLTHMSTSLTLYNAHLCVDEVMTAGRTADKFLLSDAMGLKADYVSLGKFLTQGVVLERRGISPLKPAKGRVEGISLGTSLFGMAEVLTEILTFKEGTVDEARNRMVSHLKAIKKQPGGSPQEVVIWGKGAMVYSNIMCDRNAILTGRYLPLLGAQDYQVDTSRSLMWHEKEKKNEQISELMSQEYHKAMLRMWSACVNHPKAKGH